MNKKPTKALKKTGKVTKTTDLMNLNVFPLKHIVPSVERKTPRSDLKPTTFLNQPANPMVT